MAKAAAAKKNDSEVLETHEAIVIDPVPDEETKEEGKKDPEKRMEESMNKALAKYNVTNAFLAELNTKFKHLTINGQDDKDGYTAVHDARMIFVKTRSKIKSICEAGRESAVMIQKRWVAKQKQLTEVIQAEEARLEKLEDDFDAEKERIKQEKIEMQRTRLRGRIQELLAMGAVSDGVDVYLDDVSFSQTDIREADDEDYRSDIVPAFKKIFDVKESARLEKERIDKEKQDELDRQKLEFEEKQNSFKRQQEEFENQKKAAALEKRTHRISQLENIGMAVDYRNGDYVYKEYRISNEGIDTGSDEAWRMILNDATVAIKTIKDNEETQSRLAEEKRLEDARKKAAAELRVKTRESQLKGMQFSMVSAHSWDTYRNRPIPADNHLPQAMLVDYDDERWQEIIDIFNDYARSENIVIEKENKDRILKEENDRKENDRLKKLEESEQATDKVKWGTFLDQLNQVKLPTMKRQPYKTYVENAALFIKKINAI